MNLQEFIKIVLREELNESLFFRRRINLDEVKKLLPIHAEQVYGETKSYEQFKYELTLRAVEAIMWNNYELGWEDLPEKEEIEFVNEVANMFNKTIKKLYNSQYRYVPLQEELSNPINSIRRRLDVVDWLVEFSVREIERQYNGICKVRTPETFLEIVIEKTGDGMYWDYFANTIDDDSDEWNEMYRFISIYVEQKFGDKLKQYYHTQCVELK